MDTSFNNGQGWVLQTFAESFTPTSVTIQRDSTGSPRIVVAGDGLHNVKVLRYTAAGNLDATFATEGILQVAEGSFGMSKIADTLLESDGKILLVGRALGADSGSINFGISRLTENGQFDTTFAGTGTVGTDFGAGDYVTRATIQLDGKLVAVGYTVGSDNVYHVAMARYELDAISPATLSLGGLSQTYTGTPRTVTVTTSPTGLSGLTVTYDGSTTPPTNAGSYQVVATLNNANYQAEPVSGTLVIAKANLTVTANGDSKTYDNVAYIGGNGVTYSGFVNGETPAVLGGSVVYGGTAQGAVNVGTYSITASGLTSGNYTIAYLPGTLTINAKVLEATAWSQGTINIGSNGMIVLHLAISAGQLYGTDTVASLFNGVTFTIEIQSANGSITYGTVTSTAQVESNGNITVSMQMSNDLRADLYDAYVNGRTVNFNMTATSNGGNYFIDEDTMSRLLNNGALQYVP